MDVSLLRPWLEDLEGRLAHDPEGASVSLAYVAGQQLVFDDPGLNAARRRAVLVLAAGGDPLRDLHVDDRAVTVLARELFAPERSETLAAGLAGLEPLAAGLPDALARLVADRDLAWRCLACALLAAELSEDE